jgi:hypothetical protein
MSEILGTIWKWISRSARVASGMLHKTHVITMVSIALFQLTQRYGEAIANTNFGIVWRALPHRKMVHVGV